MTDGHSGFELTINGVTIFTNATTTLVAIATDKLSGHFTDVAFVSEDERLCKRLGHLNLNTCWEAGREYELLLQLECAPVWNPSYLH